MAQGTHIIADCYECNFSEIQRLKMDGTKKYISEIIKNHELTELGAYYHSFGEDAFTGVVALAESHISIHTWPELQFVTLDIYVCNVSKNNKESAFMIFEKFKELVQSKDIKTQIIER
ncbi:MAG: adenosylmethionine decarboxylase [Candidatus Gracilibacteria bacterium]|nr:adenosylmethionine decarboxylase [Candidatus Gracilibacteria bacterium]